MYQNLENKPAETFVIPFETADSEFQIMTPNENVCPYLKEIQAQMEASMDYRARYETVTLPLLKEAQTFMAPENATENNLFDCGTVYGCHNKTVPDEYTQGMYDAVNEDVGWYGMYAAQYPNYINATKYNNGPFLKLVYSRIYGAVMSDSKNQEFDDDVYKMYLYGGHDSGVIPIIGALGYDITEWVPYADIVAFELFKRKSNGQYFVLMSYNGEILAPSMCDCDANEYQLCSWNKFKDFMQKVTPTQSECPGMRNVPSVEKLAQMYK